jgi:ATPase family protein associated with various cellular activities (AAA)/winged helix domain-containing protein
MSAPAGMDAPSWHEINQRQLSAALGRVRQALEHQAARHRGAPGAEGSLPDTPGPAPGERRSALDELCAVFGLSAFERDLLVLCAGVELDSSFAALCAAAQGDPQRAYPTWSLALAALPSPYWRALTPGAPLRRWRLLEVGNGSALTVSPLRIDERVLHYLTGVDGVDERLAGLVSPVHDPGALVPSHQQIAERVASIWTKGRPGTSPSVIQLCGDGVADMRAVAHAACNGLGLRLFVLAGDTLPAAPHEIEVLARLWQREAALGSSVLLVECDDAEGTTLARLRQLIDRTSCALLVARRERIRLGHRPTVSIDVPKPTSPEQRAVWRSALGTVAVGLNGQVELLVSHFNLNSDAIRNATVDALAAASHHGADVGRAVWNACRVQSRPRLEDLAQRIEGAPAWDDLVLPDAQRQVLREISTHVRHRLTVYEQWGFGRPGSRGLGISAMFAGASGTGKTLAAEVLATDLDLDLYRVDLSSVVSKYIGETEKNLRRIFDAADQGGAILLFDEADALFGKRSEIKDSHDRYANIEVSYLLQRMEVFRGLAILTTNMRSALDSAFLRRIRFSVQFPFPDPGQRAEIWRRIFPPDAPTEGIDLEKLAQLNIAGGNIRNIALHAAFLAADDGRPLGMGHLLRAARTEYAKAERPLTESEIQGWPDSVVR